LICVVASRLINSVYPILNSFIAKGTKNNPGKYNGTSGMFWKWY